jgi:hypothetical protein
MILLGLEVLENQRQVTLLGHIVDIHKIVNLNTFVSVEWVFMWYIYFSNEKFMIYKGSILGW